MNKYKKKFLKNFQMIVYTGKDKEESGYNGYLKYKNKLKELLQMIGYSEKDKEESERERMIKLCDVGNDVGCCIDCDEKELYLYLEQMISWNAKLKISKGILNRLKEIRDDWHKED